MLNLKSLTLGAVLAASAFTVMAQPGHHDAAWSGRHEAPRHAAATPDVDARQARQAARIEAALHDGRLSRREFRALQREQAAIRRYEAQAKADGVVTRHERRELQEMLDRASRHIRQS